METKAKDKESGKRQRQRPIAWKLGLDKQTNILCIYLYSIWTLNIEHTHTQKKIHYWHYNIFPLRVLYFFRLHFLVIGNVINTKFIKHIYKFIRRRKRENIGKERESEIPFWCNHNNKSLISKHITILLSCLHFVQKKNTSEIFFVS